MRKLTFCVEVSNDGINWIDGQDPRLIGLDLGDGFISDPIPRRSVQDWVFFRFVLRPVPTKFTARQIRTMRRIVIPGVVDGIYRASKPYLFEIVTEKLNIDARKGDPVSLIFRKKG